MSKEKVIVGYECKFVTAVPNDDPYKDDYYFVKENIHYTDGTIQPNIRIIKNYKRKFWVTAKNYRDHKSKKEWESKDKLKEYSCKESELPKAITAALELNYLRDKSMRSLSRSPYLYGTDIKVTALIKQEYAQKYPDLITPYTVCTLDIEADVTTERYGEITLVTACMADKVVCVVNQYFVGDIPSIKEKIKEKIDKYIGSYIDKRNMKVYIEIAKSEIDMIYKVFEYIHKWKPDFLAIWNINYDLPKIVEACRKARIDPADVFSDPAIPVNKRHFKYKEGLSKKSKSNGDSISLSPANRWHKCQSTSSFYFIDAMCVYRLVRLAQPEEQSYSLDNILNKELGIRKLKFEKADNYSGLQRHQFMHKNYKLEYTVYNIFDSLSMIELDEKTQDLAQSIGIMSRYSDFVDFNSQPRRLVDHLHFYCLEKNLVIGTTGDNLREEIDDKTLPLSDIIITLPAHLLVENGISNIIEDKTLHTNVRMYVSDSDIGAAYPTNQCVFNVSKETTKRELIDIKGIKRNVYRLQNINLLGGEVNAADYCVEIFNFPTLAELGEYF